MLRDLRSLYVAIADGKVVVFDTNLKDFIVKFQGIEPDARNYDYHYREFKKSDLVKWVNGKGLEYTLQKVL